MEIGIKRKTDGFVGELTLSYDGGYIYSDGLCDKVKGKNGVEYDFDAICNLYKKDTILFDTYIILNEEDSKKALLEIDYDRYNEVHCNYPENRIEVEACVSCVKGKYEFVNRNTELNRKIEEGDGSEIFVRDREDPTDYHYLKGVSLSTEIKDELVEYCKSLMKMCLREYENGKLPCCDNKEKEELSKLINNMKSSLKMEKTEISR